MTDDRKPLAERMYESGYTDLIPIIPPGAVLAPSSKVSATLIGKIPGLRYENGLWVGHKRWRETQASLQDVRTWLRWGASIGLKADRFPGLDIDTMDSELASIVESAALSRLGPAPVRVGNPPKRLLPYRSRDPFGRLRLYLKKRDATHLIEILGAGQQYLISGIHPKTGTAYLWSQDPAALGAEGLTEITREQAVAFLDYLAEAAEMLGFETKRVGQGAVVEHTLVAQPGLEAPSIDELREAVERIPNTDNLFPGWDELVKMLYAIRAAAGSNDEDGFEIFEEWRMRRNNGAGPAAPGEDSRTLWRRTHGPFVIGWSWLAEMARQFGYNDAEFPTEGTAPVVQDKPILGAPVLSDQWLALQVVDQTRGNLRYVPALERWLVWNRGRWQPDAEMLAEDTVKVELRKIANEIEKWGSSSQEQKKYADEARNICSAGKCSAVRTLVQSDRAIAVNPESLDYDPWLLNTPGGVVDLKTGQLRDPDPDQLMTKTTAVTPEFGGAMPEWTRFLDEATGGDVQLQKYLQRLTGYALTGETIEHQYTFIYGTGGNGKGKFLEAVTGILADYATEAPMDTFVASANERHATELAGLQGARLVTASETEAGKRWDEAKLKRMTGGDPIRARFMRQDFFTYIPQFKLIFIGNHKPEIRNLDEAMRRRTHLVPFLIKPKVVDKQLGKKLRAEWPAILAWMIEGCLEWQRVGLAPPAVVQEATEEYFSESDPVGQWLLENTEPADDEWVELSVLFENWKEWSNRRGEYVGKMQRLGAVLRTKGYEKGQNPRNRRVEFRGVKLVNRQDLNGALTA